MECIPVHILTDLLCSLALLVEALKGPDFYIGTNPDKA